MVAEADQPRIVREAEDYVYALYKKIAAFEAWERKQKLLRVQGDRAI